jgi:hypothetical protein
MTGANAFASVAIEIPVWAYYTMIAILKHKGGDALKE